MASINKVFVMGRLGFDPEIRHTPNQNAVATLRIATTESWNKDGQKQEQTEWHRVVVWGRQAENCAKYLSKGRSVFVEGRLQTRSWDDKTGQKRYTTEIIANNVQFIGSNAAAPSPQGGGYEDQDSRFPQAESSNDFSPAYGGATESSANSVVNFDDIPFRTMRFHHRKDLLSTCPF